MREQIPMYVVFLSQVLLISYFLPRKVLERVRYVTRTYPPSSYPRLYPVPIDRVERAQRNYRNLNRILLVLGLALIAVGFFAPSEAVLNWNGGTVVVAYFLIQHSPLILATTAGFTYFNLKRKPDTRSTRRAGLRPRHLFDFVSPTLIGVAACVYFAFVAFVAYVRTFDFPWFGGYANVLGITVMNLFFAGLIARSMRGKTKDPYRSPEDRARAIERGIRILVFFSIAATAYVALSVSLSALGLRDLHPMTLSLYLQLTSIISFRAFRIDGVNFEVYREEPATT